ncbi:MAG: TSUP family transporter [Halolamina sp.]
MTPPLTPELVGAVVAVVFVAGAVNGVAGFGFAVVGTMALATALEPATAVVFMILPVLGVNVSLAAELSSRQLRRCGRRFAPLLGAALVGTVVGLVLLRRVPTAPLRVGLGVVSLAFVATVQDAVALPTVGGSGESETAASAPAMAGIGAVSGLVFGGTNVGVQLVAYVRSFDLSHGLFVGVVAMVFLGLNAVRVVAAAVLGLYPSATVAVGSAVAAAPALAGVAVGRRLRGLVSDRLREAVVLGLLTVVGVRLVLGGLGVA